jgi:sulfoxide reductase heme-binding subunit YedZ
MSILLKKMDFVYTVISEEFFAGVIHFYWLVKADIRRPVQYGPILALLLGYRLVMIWAQRWPRFQKFQLFYFFKSWS